MNAHKKTKSIAVLMAIVALVIGSATMNTAAAADKNKSTVNATANKQQLTIQYAGELEGYVYLRISMVQASAEKSVLKIYDLSGEKLYEEAVSAKEFSRVIKLSPEELKGLNVTFTNSNNQEIKKEFAINTSTTVNYEVSEVAE